MPPRRDPRSHSAPPPAWEPSSGTGARSGRGDPGAPLPGRRRLPRLRLPRFRLPRFRLPRFRLPPLPSPTALALAGLAGLGAVISVGLLDAVWPREDRSAEPPREVSAANLAEKPHRTITVLVVGSDADRLGAERNGAAPAGPANADVLLLVRVPPKGPLQVLNLPTELAVTLPGEERPVRLGSLYRRGGVALTADAVREIVGLEPPAPDRYLVIPRGALRQLVDGAGGLELNPPRTMRYEDKAQKYKIDLQSGLQRLDGTHVEQMVRYRNKDLGESGRRANHQLVETALREQLARPEQLVRLPALLARLRGGLDTNLNEDEALSLLAAGLDDARPPRFASLPLTPPKKEHGELRQLDRKASPPLWKEP